MEQIVTEYGEKRLWLAWQSYRWWGEGGAYLRHGVHRRGSWLVFGQPTPPYLFGRGGLVVLPSVFEALVSAGWPKEEWAMGEIVERIDVPWRAWERGEAHPIFEKGGSAYLGSRWPRVKLREEVMVLRPCRTIDVSVFSRGILGLPLRLLTTADPSGVAAVAGRKVYGKHRGEMPGDEAYVFSAGARKALMEAVPDDGGLRWEAVEVVTAEELADYYK